MPLAPFKDQEWKYILFSKIKLSLFPLIMHDQYEKIQNDTKKKKNLLIIPLPWRLLLWIGRYMTIQTGNCIYTLYSLKVYINYIRHEIVDLNRSGPGLFPMSGVFCSIYQLYPTWDSWSETFWSWPVPNDWVFSAVSYLVSPREHDRSWEEGLPTVATSRKPSWVFLSIV